MDKLNEKALPLYHRAIEAPGAKEPLWKLW